MIRGAKPKDRMMTSSEKSTGSDATNDGKLTKIRKCPLRCIVCCAVSDPKNKVSK
jgi:hypothetical protein